MTAPTPDLEQQILHFVESDWGVQRDLFKNALQQLLAVTADRNRAEAKIAQAPHSDECAYSNFRVFGTPLDRRPPCDCWKSGL